MNRHLFVPLCLLLLLGAASAEDDPLPALVSDFLADPSAEAVKALLLTKADPAKVAALLAAGRAYPAEVKTGWSDRTVEGPDGVERNWLLYVPEDYTPENRYRLIVDLHGGVSRPRVLTHRELDQMKFFWGEHAAENGCLLAIPTGQSGAEWWTEIGAANVLRVIGRAKREYNVDENRVLATGFSDGGSGCYYLAVSHPTPFAGFIPLNGHPSVAQAGGRQIHLRNLTNKPTYAVNTEKDSLYPSAAVKPIMDALRKLGAALVWREIPEYTHNPAYLPAERPAIARWMEGVVRDPSPERVVWEGTAGAPRRVHWLVVGEVSGGAGKRFPDVNPLLPPGRVRLGVHVDQEFAGPGVRVSKVVEGSPAEAAGLEAGDILLKVDEMETPDFRALRAALSKKDHGEAFGVTVARGEETLDLTGTFAKAEPQPAFRREEEWGSVEAKREGNAFTVSAEGIASFDLCLGADVDLSKPVTVTVNGAEVLNEVVAPDLAFLLEMAGRDDDRTMLYLARVRVEVPAK